MSVQLAKSLELSGIRISPAA